MRIATFIPNFRDLGGLSAAGMHLPHGRLFRTSALLQARLGESSTLAGQAPGAVYFDLRTNEEVARHGSLVLPPDWVYRHRPLYTRDVEQFSGQPLFAALLSRYRPVMLQVACAVADAPVVVACSLGKDRTGFVVAAMLQMLGVERETILQDYTFSNEHLACFRFDTSYDLVARETCVGWLDYLSANLDAPAAVIAAVRSILVPAPVIDTGHANR